MKRTTRQRGVTVLVVLVLLSVMLLAGLGLARLSELGTLVAGNVSFKERAVQASEVAFATAYQRVQALADENDDAQQWYYATARQQDSDGMPRSMEWSNAPEVLVGPFSARYVVERLCDETPGADLSQHCLVRTTEPGTTPVVQSAVDGREQLESSPARQFRVTIRVTGPKNTVTFVQGMLTRS